MNFAAELVIVGQIISDGCESADAVEVGSPESQRRPESELGHSDEGSHQCARCEICRDAQGFPPAWPGRPFRSIDTRDQADRWIAQGTRHIADVIRGDGDVGIVYDDHRVAGRFGQIDQNADFLIRGCLRAVDCADLCSGEFGDGLVDFGEGGVLRILIAEEEFEGWIILVRMGTERFAESFR